jgi:uncharacterized protein (DUF1778 family)
LASSRKRLHGGLGLLFSFGAVQCPYVPGGVALTSAKPPGHRPAKTSRIELRATEDDRDLLDRAAAALGTDRSSFLLSQGRLAAQRVLADREQFVLDADGQQEWERINSRPARSLPGLARLLERPSPFVTPAADQPQA